MKTWFLSWIIPSFCSLTFSSLMFFHLLIFNSIFQHIFPFLSSVTTLGDIIQCISFFWSTCPHRVILFQSGLLIKCFSSFWSLILLTLFLQYHQRYHQRTLWVCNFCWLLFFLLLIGTYVRCQTWELFCDEIGSKGYLNNITNISSQMKLTYFLSFLLPVMGSILGIILLSIVNLFFLQSSIVPLPNHQLPLASLFPLLRRLHWYPIITATCSLPGLVAIIQLLTSGTTSVLLLNISACTVSLTGSFISILYLYQSCHYSTSNPHASSSLQNLSSKHSLNGSTTSEHSKHLHIIRNHGSFFQWTALSSSSLHQNKNGSDRIWDGVIVPSEDHHIVSRRSWKGRESSSLMYQLLQEGNEESGGEEEEDRHSNDKDKDDDNDEKVEERATSVQSLEYYFPMNSPPLKKLMTSMTPATPNTPQTRPSLTSPKSTFDRGSSFTSFTGGSNRLSRFHSSDLSWEMDDSPHIEPQASPADHEEEGQKAM
jgi:hypothetical protein